MNRSMDVEMEHLNLNRNVMNLREKELQIVVQSPSKVEVPDGWLVEQRPRPSNPNHIDRYYIEPHTGQKFRSLVSVQRYLNGGETGDYLPTQRIISENNNNLPDGWLVEHRPRLSNSDRVDRYYIEPRTGQKFRSLTSVQRYLMAEARDYLPTERMISENATCIKSRTAQKLRPAKDFEGRLSFSAENACRATPKLVFKCGSGKKSAPSISYKENDSQKKIKIGEDDRGSIHNLARPPTKVSWVLSDPRGFWNPFLDDSVVPASEKRKWSEAFSISINEGATSGVNN
ncbi:putative DNA-binding domain-containing protein [Medicago truncatula]|uniref:Methyl-CpG binding n=1 Tax=Medicago truncatula TaxID=3880 RepID=Q2HU61_MEDTR|nr:methyl-CpG-binding domain-containing protein 7 isoform X2 [Medicago truncatula]ABD32284.2 Methyl-CpG binding [Medicago truncatula]AES67588.2 methyl-CpG-binding domain protein [Medicago truncatula]AFK39448.1 unknown [Medicago truncatula]RHN76054.1 putative DNA-binding domain-containing protein [Medicago truncatula]